MIAASAGAAVMVSVVVVVVAGFDVVFEFKSIPFWLLFPAPPNSVPVGFALRRLPSPSVV